MLLSDNLRCVLDHKGWGIYSVAPETFVFDAVQQMADRDIGALAVMGRAGILGLFSERDYARKIILLGRSSKDTTVGEVMSHPARMVAPEDTIAESLRAMTTFRLRHLVVAQEGRPVGIVSIGDLVNRIMSAQEEMIGQLKSYIQGDYPG